MYSRKKVIREIRHYFGCQYAIPVGSGTLGLSLLLQSLGLDKKKVIVPVLVCPNVLIAVYAAGCIPVAVDVSKDDCNISPEALREAMCEDIRAIIAVDTFGYPASIDKIKEMAKPFGAAVIEDACQAYGGASGDGRAIGNRGDAGVISFGYAKPVPLQGGGMVLTDSDEMAERVKHLQSALVYRLFTNRKNNKMLDLMKKGDYDTMRQSLHTALFQYNFPTGLFRKLQRQWPLFVADISVFRKALYSAYDLLSGCKSIELFDYAGDKWLPWRMSFRIPDEEGRRKFIELAGKEHLIISNLYPPVNGLFPDVIYKGDEQQARQLSGEIFNLCYPLDKFYLEGLLMKLKTIASEWKSF